MTDRSEYWKNRKMKAPPPTDMSIGKRGGRKRNPNPPPNPNPSQRSRSPIRTDTVKVTTTTTIRHTLKDLNVDSPKDMSTETSPKV